MCHCDESKSNYCNLVLYHLIHLCYQDIIMHLFVAQWQNSDDLFPNLAFLISCSLSFFVLFREVSCDRQTKKLPEGKAIDDPVYINVKVQCPHWHKFYCPKKLTAKIKMTKANFYVTSCLCRLQQITWLQTAVVQTIYMQMWITELRRTAACH